MKDLNTMEVTRKIKGQEVTEILKGAVHGWTTWKEFKAHLIHKYDASVIDENTLECYVYTFHRC